MSESDSDTVTVEHVELRSLRQRRGVIKGKLFSKYISSLPRTPSAEMCIDIQMRIEKMENVYNDFETIQDEIETYSTDLDSQIAERESFQNTYFSAMTKAKSYVTVPETNLKRDTSMCDQTTHRNESVKFPDKILPTFSGDVTEWLEFRDTFDALINKTELKPIQKLKYLKSCVRDRALSVISALEFTDESYNIAWQLLCERFNNPKQLVTNHLEALLGIKNIPKDPNAYKVLADNISKHLRIINSLNVSTDNWDTILIFILVSKLDAQTQRKWKERTNSSKLPSLQNFKSYLRSEADLIEPLTSRGMESNQAPMTKRTSANTSSPA